MEFVAIPTQLVSYESNCWRFPNFQIVTACDPEKDKPVSKQIARPFPGTYSSVFYKTMALFYSENTSLSVVLMRLFNSLFMAVTVAVASHILASTHRYSISVLIPLIPNVAFFVASVNPTSWSLIALYGLASSLVGIHLQGVNRLNMMLGLSASVFCFFSRPDTKYTYFVILILLFIFTIFNKKSQIPNSLIIFSVFSVSSLLIYLSWQFRLHQEFRLASFSGERNFDSLELIVHNLSKTPQFFIHMISPTSGSYASSLTALPFMLITNLLIAYLLIKAIQYSSLTVQVLIVFQIVGLIALVNVFHLIWGIRIFDSIQPRYFLPLFIVLLVFAGTQSSRRINRRTYALISSLAILILFGSLHTTMRRWSVGMFEFSKTGLFQYTIDDKWYEIMLYQMNLKESLKSLLFLDSKWSPIIAGGQLGVLLLAGIGGLLLISGQGLLDSRLKEQTK